MKSKILLLSLLIASSFLFAQNPTIVQQEWVKTYSYQDSIYNTATAIDVNGDIYVTGYTYDAVTKANITTIKYDSQGNEIWVKHYNGASNWNDRATGIIYDSNGNIFVCGFTTDGTTNINYLLIKYDSNGNEIWAKIYDNGDYDIPNDIALDAYDNIYITGQSKDAGNYDILTLKYTQNGALAWEKRKDNGNNDYAKKIIIINNKIFVGGYGKFAFNDYFLICYDLNGVEQYTTVVPTNNNDYAEDMVVDIYSNIYLTGSNYNLGISEYYTVKFNAGGSILWHNEYKSSDNWNRASSICTDNTGDIYITGMTIGTNINTITTLKYNNAGDELWTQKYYTETQLDKSTVKIVCDNSTGVYIGTTTGTAYNNDYCTIKYDFEGVEKWLQTFNGIGNGQDIVSDLTVDSQNNVYVTGQSFNGNNFDFATIKYSYRDILFPTDYQNEPASGVYTYRQNKGQLKRTDSIPAEEVKFYCATTVPQYYIQEDKLSYVFSNIAHTTPLKADSLVRFDMELLKTNQHKLFAFESVNSKLNYFLEHIPDGRVNINGYKRIVRPNIYNNIDLEYYSNEAGFKFYFVVYPGGNESEILMKFNGADNVSVTPSGGLKIETQFGDIDYEKALVYRVNQGGNDVPMPTSGNFDVTNDFVTINVNNYPSNQTLVIVITEDHAIVQQTAQIGNLGWSTYHTDLASGLGRDMGLDVCHDDIGNVYTVGKTDRPDFPNDNGYFEHKGLFDAYLSKFDPITMHKFTTFYGGIDNDDAWSVAYNSINDRIYFTGKVESKDIFIQESANTNAYNQDVGYGGLSSLTDAYIAKFTAFDGQPKWTSYFSGNGDDEGRAIVCDKDGNIYLTGNTSTNFAGNNAANNPCEAPDDEGFPICNALDNTYNGNQDIFLAKFDINDNLLFSTFFGGTELDNVFDIEILETQDAGRIYFVGSTESSNFPLKEMPPTGIHFYSNQWVSSPTAFISDLSIDGSILNWSTFFPRVKEFQSVSTYSRFLKFPYYEAVYAIGITEETSMITNSCQPETTGIPICNSNGISSVQSVNNGSHDLFISKFSSYDLAWSTLYGGFTDEYSDIPENFYEIDKFIASDVADNGHLYITGLTEKNPLGIFPTINEASYYYDNDNLGSSGATDMFLLGYNDDNQLYWATLFGGGDNASVPTFSSSDFVGGLSAYKEEYIHLTAWSGTYNYPDAYLNTGNPPEYYHPTLPFYTGEPVSTVSRFGIIAGVGIDELENSETGNINVYPNPAYDYIYIDTDNKEVEYTIYNNTGQLIQSDIFNNNINVSHLSTGFYIVTIKTKDNSYNIKFIKE